MRKPLNAALAVLVVLVLALSRWVSSSPDVPQTGIEHRLRR